MNLSQISSSIPAIPEKIRVSGLPFMLQGWNAVYNRVRKLDSKDGVIFKYRLDSYTLYGFIVIIGTEIRYKNEKWEFWRDGDDEPFAINLVDNGTLPTGYWVSNSGPFQHQRILISDATKESTTPTAVVLSAIIGLSLLSGYIGSKIANHT